MENSNKKIAKNTLLLYFRMFLTMGVSLYTSRVVLNVLGVNDYGIYSVIGGVVALFVFLNGAMSSATQRFLAVDIGREDWARLHKTFNAALIIHIGIALVILLIAETAGLWFINHKLVIPGDRIAEANFVYQFSVLSSIITITQVPFNAIIIARERMSAFALIGIVEVLLKLIIVYLLFISSFDKLKTYAVLLVVVAFLVSTIYKIYCVRNFKETKFKLFAERGAYKELLAYSGWNLFGNIAAVAKGQGVNILLNLFFGTVVNAAYGIMMQVQGAIGGFVQNFQTAINPQIYKSYGRGDRETMQYVMFKGAKLSFFLLLILVCPVVFNIHFVLTWWLKNPPAYTEVFVTLMLVNLTIESISYPLITGALATGKIKWYQVIVGMTLIFNLPVNYFMFKAYADPVYFLYVAILLSLITLVFRVLFLRRMLGLNIRTFFREVLWPVIAVSLLCFGVLHVAAACIGRAASFIQLLYESFFLIGIISVLIFFIGLSRSERASLRKFARKKIARNIKYESF
ncbi:Na+-driven multidrug efflux pump [Niabella drilacis]|uniref:Na+-driven multidrug efflux pump n=1 Tax=Niabella drilacis (strain DSM 25811 / CCM 8410 / CCUG 62505 / LMG 26954 / E90) TaxID=1285928 RepID=A0A1G6LL61_NIADE|nr:Na+-driven multidrug efflux pump [Niabella drilacis]